MKKFKSNHTKNYLYLNVETGQLGMFEKNFWWTNDCPVYQMAVSEKKFSLVMRDLPEKLEGLENWVRVGVL